VAGGRNQVRFFGSWKHRQTILAERAALRKSRHPTSARLLQGVRSVSLALLSESAHQRSLAAENLRNFARVVSRKRKQVLMGQYLRPCI